MPRVILSAGTWTDLYAASGIAVGTKIIVQNVSQPVVTLSTSASEPEGLTGSVITPYTQAENKQGSVGEWAYSLLDSTLQVDEA